MARDRVHMMAVYFDYKVKSPVVGHNTDIQWHKSSPLLAVASYVESTGQGQVNLFMEEGDHVVDCKDMKRSHPATALAWHPTKKILAVGWETGEIQLWNETTKELHEVFPLHKGEISILHWSSKGSQLLSGDSGGMLVLWNVDLKGRPQQQPASQESLDEQVTQCVQKPLPPPEDERVIPLSLIWAYDCSEINKLALAAVRGDPKAMEMFSWHSNTLHMKKKSVSTEARTYFIGGQKGGVYFLNESGKIEQQFTAEGPVRKLLYYEDKNILITVTTTMMLTQHTVSADGQIRESLKVKLSGKSDNVDFVWAGSGVLAMCTGEGVLRMWNLDQEENYILNLESHSGYNRMENLNCLSYCESKGILACGTSEGNVAMWKYEPNLGPTKTEPEQHWALQPPSTVGEPIAEITWGSSRSLVALNTVDAVFILSEQVMSAHYNSQTAVVQTGPMSLSVDVFSTNSHHDLKTDIQIKGVFTTKDALAVWDVKRLVVYEISKTGDQALIRAAGTFITDTLCACLYEQNVYTLEPGKIQVRTFQGTVKQLLPFTEPEGNPVFIDICGHYLVAASSAGWIRIYDLARREAKQCGGPKNLSDVVLDLGSIESVRCNSNGSRVSVIVNKKSGQPDPRIYIWDVEMDTVQFFSFETGHGEQDDMTAQQDEREEDLSEEERSKNMAARDIRGRHPVSHYWDPNEPKLLVCEAKLLPLDKKKEQKDMENRAISLTKTTMVESIDMKVVSLFVTPENGILIQDSFALSSQHSGLLGLEVPFYYFSKKANVSKESLDDIQASGVTDRPQTAAQEELAGSRVSRRVMRDFVGLEQADKNTRDAMMNFSFYLTVGNMDEAFKAIKLIKSESVWENMAKMCVKNRRLDVAAVCLGNMGHARGAKALREATKEQELDAKVAILALQLGLHEDAERLFKSSQRYDLLNEYYQATGQWGKALETSEMYDRVHLRTTYYNYAKHLENKGDINGAIPNFEKSETHRFEVPRMLFDEPQALETYIMKTKDPVLRKWWAQYMESTSEMETALQFYEAAKDFLSLVRVYCYCDQIDKAAQICNETGDKAACYHLARQYENNEQYREAVHFFTRAGAYGNAIRLSRDAGNEDQLLNLALLGKSDDMVEAAQYYENRAGCQDKAVMLYHKAGHFSKALDLAFQTKQFQALQMVSEDLDSSTDPELLQRCADFFIENSQYDRAVDLLAIAKKYWDALKICMEQHVPMTEELVEKLTPSKEFGERDPEEKNKILEGIAEVCMQQREYHLATKKYTQAGNKVKAMKALLKSGDTEKIVFFAGVSRQKEIYVMAANYLQSLDWRKDPEIMKNIISFYTKGRALDSLSSFYDACAQVEIDEYQNYDKALGALNEAYKCMAKAKVKNEMLQEERLADLKNRMGLIKKFIQVRRTYEEDTEEAMKQCQVLLGEPNVDTAVRIGDVCGLMIEHYARKQKWQAAYNSMEELKSRLPRVNLAYYVNMKTIEQIHRALDIPMKEQASGGVNGYRNSPEEMGEEVEEEVVESY